MTRWAMGVGICLALSGVVAVGCGGDDAAAGGDGGGGSDAGGGGGDGGSRDAGGGGGGDGGGDVDAGGGGDVDAGGGGDVDAGGGDVDAGGGGDVDAGGSDVDAGGGGGVDAGGGGGSDGGVTACTGVECAGFPASFVRGCTVDDNCVGEVHQTDCCGARSVLGMNHSEVSTFCTAEATCRASYPTSSCSSTAIMTDTGMAPALDNTAVHCVGASSGALGTCTTFVCNVTGGVTCPAARRIGTCPTPGGP